MGHTKPPFTWQYQIEKGYFSKFRRALLLNEDKCVFDLLWNKAEFHITAAEKASHPLPHRDHFDDDAPRTAEDHPAA